jgi:hypothetical protein
MGEIAWFLTGVKEAVQMILFLMVLPVAAYFVPAIASIVRDKDDAGAIFLWNLFLGWTVVVWLVCLIWAFRKDAPKELALVPG